MPGAASNRVVGIDAMTLFSHCAIGPAAAPGSSGSRIKPAVWLPSCRIVGGDAPGGAFAKPIASGRYLVTGASRSTFPRCTACMSAAAVNDLLIEPMR